MRTQDRLLEAHVAFVLRDLTGERFADLVGTEVDWALSRAAELPLDAVIERADVTAVAVKYASAISLAGAIPETVGEIAARLREHPASETTLGELVPRQQAVALARKIAELQPLRQRIAGLVAESPVVQAWFAEYLRSAALWPVDTNRRILGRVPGVSYALAAGERLAGSALQAADQRSREVAERAAGALLAQWSARMSDAVSDDEVAEALISAWDRSADRSVRELLDATDDDDLIDLIVLGFEVWLELRDGAFVPAVIEMGVDYVFDTYGSYTLLELLTEFGVNRYDLVEESMRFAPRALTTLTATGDLEAFVRRQLARFYDSPEARAALED